jgi:SAM-dependent methyltransferase
VRRRAREHPDTLARTSKIAPNRHAPHPFDRKYGTDTGGYLSPEELRHGAAHDAMNNGYSAVAPSVFLEACRRWRETIPATARVEAYTFVDVGAGKGRALLLAAEIPFRKVVGIELNEDLARIAQRNVTLWTHATRSRENIRVLPQDALEFRWPRAPLLVYLNNPFDCELVEELAARLAAVAAAGPSLVDLLYVNPACADTLTGPANYKLLWNAQIRMDVPDQRADPYGAVSDRVAAFRFRAARPGGTSPEISR